MGIHNADCFQVEDQWFIEEELQDNKKLIKLNVRFRIHFLKYTMWKHIIDKMTKVNTIHNFNKYIIMIQQSSSAATSIEKEQEQEEKKSTMSNDVVIEHINNNNDNHCCNKEHNNNNI